MEGLCIMVGLHITKVMSGTRRGSSAEVHATILRVGVTDHFGKCSATTLSARGRGAPVRGSKSSPSEVS